MKTGCLNKQAARFYGFPRACRIGLHPLEPLGQG